MKEPFSTAIQERFNFLWRIIKTLLFNVVAECLSFLWRQSYKRKIGIKKTQLNLYFLIHYFDLDKNDCIVIIWLEIAHI